MSKQEEKFFALHDEVINQVKEALQLAMITGTNIVDHLRQFRLTASEDDSAKLVLTNEYKDYHLTVVGKLLAEAEKLHQEPDELTAPQEKN